MKPEKFYSEFTSGTLAATSVQSSFDQPGTAVSYAFYRPFPGGEYPLSLLFSNTVDSTIRDGSEIRANDPCGEWTILKIAVAVTETADEPAIEAVKNWRILTIDGATAKPVSPREVFCTDEITINVPETAYLCVKVVFVGERVPCHFENLIPTFKDDGDGVKPSKFVPLPCIVGIKRPVKARVAFWGDSITQGIGCPENSYRYYAAVAARILGTEYSYYDAGIGFARAADAATDGAWADRVKRCDVIVVCFGVNDINRGASFGRMKTNLEKIVDIVRSAGKKPVFQTVPPFDYNEETGAVADETNAYLKSEFPLKGIPVFDCASYLTAGGDTHKAIYGGHPNAEGSEIWGKALAAFLKDKL